MPPKLNLGSDPSTQVKSNLQKYIINPADMTILRYTSKGGIFCVNTIFHTISLIWNPRSTYKFHDISKNQLTNSFFPC